MEGRLAFVSAVDPAAGFNVGNAMQRNKLIYALADAALVVNSDYNKGGTWNGAIEQLEKYSFGPVFVRIGGNAGKGNEALVRKGALPWPEPKDGEALQAAIVRGAENAAHEVLQDSLPLLVKESPPAENAAEPAQEVPAQPSVPPAPPTAAVIEDDLAKQLFSTVKNLVGRSLLQPASEQDVARRLGVSGPQAKAWLQRLANEGVIEKTKKPVRYRSIQAQKWLDLS
jgi:predicted Rossmann fold nucleotide-binding protein DprA/Smf involved in DNA uptake